MANVRHQREEDQVDSCSVRHDPAQASRAIPAAIAKVSRPAVSAGEMSVAAGWRGAHCAQRQ
ncbi:hypothetical protein ASE49_01030 [Novosphingobium sp. Leaf2]|nr:hypothetical protein ASE49_01030 [Novosphingobium sp. Leaf2]